MTSIRTPAPVCGRRRRAPITDREEHQWCQNVALWEGAGCDLHLTDDEHQAVLDGRLLNICSSAARERAERRTRSLRAAARPPACASWKPSLAVAVTSVDPVDAISVFQNGRCAGCGAEKTASGLRLDHCHETDLVRGFLCQPCNRMADTAPPRHPRWMPYRLRPPAVILGVTTWYPHGKAGRKNLHPFPEVAARQLAEFASRKLAGEAPSIPPPRRLGPLITRQL
ncbi:endonuclease domain-containing protein [Streptomyces bobili]|uniref:endonuclease domain-containing protein n=1 Tax=Streptomyces bobili TaxID=67280 RepID=UPI00371F20EB